VVLKAGQPAGVALAALRAARILGAPVSDADGIYLGTASRDHLYQVIETDPAAKVDRGVDESAGTVSAKAHLSEAIDALIGAGGQWVTVTDDERRVTGILTAGAVVRAYRDAQEASAPAALAS
jgi:predicted transcriptional regulator